jgi:hypothetical protein
MQYTPISKTRPAGLELPCDQDTSTLSAESCAFLPTDILTNYQCVNGVKNTYGDTVGLVSDIKCPGEDRILQCELSGGVVASNIAPATIFSFINPAFLKSSENANVLKNITQLWGESICTQGLKSQCLVNFRESLN